MILSLSGYPTSQMAERELVKPTSKHFDVTPVVTFPGWFIERVARADHVIVLEYTYRQRNT